MSEDLLDRTEDLQARVAELERQVTRLTSVDPGRRPDADTDTYASPHIED